MFYYFQGGGTTPLPPSSWRSRSAPALPLSSGRSASIIQIHLLLFYSDTLLHYSAIIVSLSYYVYINLLWCLILVIFFILIDHHLYVGDMLHYSMIIWFCFYHSDQFIILLFCHSVILFYNNYTFILLCLYQYILIFDISCFFCSIRLSFICCSYVLFFVITLVYF